MEDSIDQLAERIWEYHHVHHRLEKADVLFVLCSHDIRIAEYAVELFLQGYAPLILFSGGVAHTDKDDLLNTRWDKSEAEMFADVAMQHGVPKEKMLLEKQATNTGENIQFGYQVMQQQQLKVNKIILVQKPYMERRAYATFKKQWPGGDVEMTVTSPPISFAEYPNAEITKDALIHIMVGDLQRIKQYAEQGFQIPQEIPVDVWDAYEQLVAVGYTKHLIRKDR